jgi:hypothetical protein
MTWSTTLFFYLLPIHPPIFLVTYLPTYYPSTHYLSTFVPTLVFVTWFLSHSYILCALILKIFVVRILGQKQLFKHSLWILELLFLKAKILDFFLGLGKNLETCSNLTCYAKNSTLIMYLSMKKIQTFNMNVPLCDNVFQMKGSIGYIERRRFFLVPNHTFNHYV